MKKINYFLIFAILLLPGLAFADQLGGGGGGGGIIITSNCDQAPYYPLGTLCQEAADGKLYKGTGAAVVEIAAGSSGDMAVATYDINVDGIVDNSEALKSAGSTGKMTVIGPAAGTTRAKTIRDADDTLLELGGSYVPTGDWRFPLPLSLGTASTTLGQLVFYNNVNANPFTIFPGATGVGVGWRFPIAAPGGSNYLLNVDADGTMDYTNPATFQAAGSYQADIGLTAKSDSTSTTSSTTAASSTAVKAAYDLANNNCPAQQLIDGHGATTNLTSANVTCPASVDNTGQSGANALVVWPTKSNAQGITLQVATTVANTYYFGVDFGAAVAYLDGNHTTAYRYCGYAATAVVEGNFMRLDTVRSSTYGASGIAVNAINGIGAGTCWN